MVKQIKVKCTQEKGHKIPRGRETVDWGKTNRVSLFKQRQWEGEGYQWGGAFER